MRALLLAVAVLLVAAAPASAAPKVLLTGDSLMENVGDELQAALEARGASVALDAQPGSGIAIPVLDWVAYARAQVDAVAPQATVMFNGAGDSVPLDVGDGRYADCCGPAWRRAYAARAAQMMRAYRRDGGRVFWLTVPLPRNPKYVGVISAVNRSVKDAARRSGARVTVVDLVPALSPGRFRRSVRWRGRTRVVRAGDGIHLTRAGADIVVAKVLAAMRRTGAL